MKRKGIICITILAMLVSLFSINVSAVQPTKLSGGQLLKQEVLEDGLLNNQNSNVENSEDASIIATYLENYINSNNNAKQVYGGCYIDDNGRLNVLLTNNATETIINDIKTVTDDSAILGNCECTLEELNILKEYISDYMVAESSDEQIKEVIENISAVGIYQKQNKIFVRLKNYDDENIQDFKGIISNSNAIIFEQSQGYIPCSSTLMCGSKICIASGSIGGEYSIAFRCKRLTSSGNYATGFMTAAHGNNAGDTVYVYTGSNSVTSIGYVMAWCYTNNGRVDSAFVCINNSNYIMSNTIHAGAGTLVAGAYSSTYTEGNTVYMAGATSTLASGRIVSNSVVADGSEDDGVTIRDCVQASYFSDEGDSGGLVYIQQNGSKYIAGINMAESYNRNNIEDGSLFVKMSNIRDVFDIILY